MIKLTLSVIVITIFCHFAVSHDGHKLSKEEVRNMRRHLAPMAFEFRRTLAKIHPHVRDGILQHLQTEGINLQTLLGELTARKRRKLKSEKLSEIVHRHRRDIHNSKKQSKTANKDSKNIKPANKGRRNKNKSKKQGENDNKKRRIINNSKKLVTTKRRRTYNKNGSALAKKQPKGGNQNRTKSTDKTKRSNKLL